MKQNKVQKILTKIEADKELLQKLVIGTNDEKTITVGCGILQELATLYPLFKEQSSDQTIIKENFLGIYLHLLKVPTLLESELFERMSTSQGIKPFAADLKVLHYQCAALAQRQNQQLLLGYHLRKVVQMDPSAQSCQDLSQYYMDNNELTSALLALKHYTGPFVPQVFYQKLYCLNKMCDFKAIENEIPKLKELLDEGNSDCIVLFLKWIGLDNATVFKVTKNYQRSREGRQDFVFKGTRDHHKPVRLGYIGSNFTMHAQSIQFGNSFFKKHNKNFELYVYSLRPGANTAEEDLVKAQVDHYEDCKYLSDEEVVQKIRADQIDIIVNCNGHADDRRPYEILCRRVAPIQIDYLGYPGTSGSTYIDYYIGDPVSTPPDSLARYFTEKLILLPHTYQITEHSETYPDLPLEKLSSSLSSDFIYDLIVKRGDSFRQQVLEFIRKHIIDEVRYLYMDLHKGEAPLTSFEHQVQWLEVQKNNKKIPQLYLDKFARCITLFNQLLRVLDGNTDALKAIYKTYVSKIVPPESFVKGRFVFGSLNHHVKLSRKDIECWNQILKQVKNSVLILFLMFSHEPQANVLQYFDLAVQDRIYFVGAAPKWLHLQRLRAIDCVLDSFYYGAHTTAGDAIWAQVPLVTCSGSAMESRVCSSMLYAAGLPELVSKDMQGYIECAIKCATDLKFYQQILSRMRQARKSPLFDRDAYIQDLCSGYKMAWERFCEGKEPSHILVK